MKGLKIFDLFKVYFKYIDQIPIASFKISLPTNIAVKETSRILSIYDCFGKSTFETIIAHYLATCDMIVAKGDVYPFRCPVGKVKMLKSKTSF